MKYHISVTTNTNNSYEFVASDEVAQSFTDFVNGVNKEQFFTFVGGKNSVMLSHKAIEHVLFEGVEDNV